MRPHLNRILHLRLLPAYNDTEQRLGAAQSFNSFVYVLNDVDNEPDVDQVSDAFVRIASEMRIPACCIDPVGYQAAHVIAPPAAIIKKGDALANQPVPR